MSIINQDGNDACQGQVVPGSDATEKNAYSEHGDWAEEGRFKESPKPDQDAGEYFRKLTEEIRETCSNYRFRLAQLVVVKSAIRDEYGHEHDVYSLGRVLGHRYQPLGLVKQGVYRIWRIDGKGAKAFRVEDVYEGWLEQNMFAIEKLRTLPCYDALLDDSIAVTQATLCSKDEAPAGQRIPTGTVVKFRSTVEDTPVVTGLVRKCRVIDQDVFYLVIAIYGDAVKHPITKLSEWLHDSELTVMESDVLVARLKQIQKPQSHPPTSWDHAPPNVDLQEPSELDHLSRKALSESTWAEEHRDMSVATSVEQTPLQSVTDRLDAIHISLDSLKPTTMAPPPGLGLALSPVKPIQRPTPPAGVPVNVPSCGVPVGTVSPVISLKPMGMLCPPAQIREGSPSSLNDRVSMLGRPTMNGSGWMPSSPQYQTASFQMPQLDQSQLEAQRQQMAAQIQQQQMAAQIQQQMHLNMVWQMMSTQPAMQSLFQAQQLQSAQYFQTQTTTSSGYCVSHGATPLNGAADPYYPPQVQMQRRDYAQARQQVFGAGYGQPLAQSYPQRQRHRQRPQTKSFVNDPNVGPPCEPAGLAPAGLSFNKGHLKDKSKPNLRYANWDTLERVTKEHGFRTMDLKELFAFIQQQSRDLGVFKLDHGYLNYRANNGSFVRLHELAKEGVLLPAMEINHLEVGKLIGCRGCLLQQLQKQLNVHVQAQHDHEVTNKHEPGELDRVMKRLVWFYCHPSWESNYRLMAAVNVYLRRRIELVRQECEDWAKPTISYTDSIEMMKRLKADGTWYVTRNRGKGQRRGRHAQRSGGHTVGYGRRTMNTLWERMDSKQRAKLPSQKPLE